MPASFAALETRVNTAVVRTLSNRVAVYTPSGGGAVEIEGIFEQPYERELEGLAGASVPTFTALSSLMPDVARGDVLSIDAVEWEIVEPAPDGAGMTVLALRKAS